MLHRPFTPDPLSVPRHIVPSLRPFYEATLRDFAKAGRCVTSREVEAEACRRYEQAHARVPGLFGSDPGEEQR